MAAPVNQEEFNQALGEVLSRLRDVSMRDGTQSLDNSAWPIEHLVPVAKEMEKLARLMREAGYDEPSIETFGGNSFSGPANQNKENPCENQKKICEAAPSLIPQSLYRGRQAYGQIPVSDEGQKEAIYESAKAGVRVIRIFDSKNYFENMITGAEAVNQYNREHPNKEDQLMLEGSICYMSADEKTGQRAWTFPKYAELAAKLVKQGCREIVVKDYAGQLTNSKEAILLIKTLRKGLIDALGEEGRNIPLNLHSHGQKPELLDAWLAADENPRNKVDIAFGTLSRGHSHTNIMDVVGAQMRRKGFADLAPYKDNPMLKQISVIESTIDTISQIHIPYRFPADLLTEQEILDSKIAGGAMGPLWGDIQKMYTPIPNTNPPQNYMTGKWHNVDWSKPCGIDEKTGEPLWNKGRMPTAEEFMRLVVKQTAIDWKRAGQPDTVTPGSTILYTQTYNRLIREIAGKPMSFSAINTTYRNNMLGRYGEDVGLKNGLGDQKLYHALLMDEALDCIKAHLKNGAIKPESVPIFLEIAGLTGIKNLAKDTGRNDPVYYQRMYDANIDKFRDGIKKSGWNPEVVEAVLRETEQHLSPPSKLNMDIGINAVEQLEREGISFRTHEEKHTAAVVSMLLTSAKELLDGSLPQVGLDVFRASAMAKNHNLSTKQVRSRHIEKAIGKGLLNNIALAIYEENHLLAEGKTISAAIPRTRKEALLTQARGELELAGFTEEPIVKDWGINYAMGLMESLASAKIDQANKEAKQNAARFVKDNQRLPIQDRLKAWTGQLVNTRGPSVSPSGKG